MAAACRLVFITVALLVVASSAGAQELTRTYVGGLFGVSTLSPDAQAVTTPQTAGLSHYAPENGAALNAVFGVYVGQFVSIQTNYVWNRNGLTLFSSVITPEGGTVSEQRRSSSQHTVVADALLYFRERDRRVRPYLSTGFGAMHFESEPTALVVQNGTVPPLGRFTSTRPVFRVAVGVDIVVSGRASFRYSYSDTITGNPVSARLAPAGQRRLMNFQSLFGAVFRL
jgi:hypothetical protein